MKVYELIQQLQARGVDPNAQVIAAIDGEGNGYAAVEDVEWMEGFAHVILWPGSSVKDGHPFGAG